MNRVDKPAAFRALLESPCLEFICEAHHGLSARIVEEAGFKGVWASGLAIAAQLGVRDNNEASWTQVLDVIEFMADATSIPIMLDGDTGYGNFNNVQRLVRKLEQRDIAAVCLEDKVFPKTNSFIDGHRQPLADIEEFCGKIKAGKDAAKNDSFCIVARVEAFIAGWGLAEALRRAEAYRAAGADAILIHSALRSADEVLAFKTEWGNRSPVVIVPTTYYGTPTDVFRTHGFSLAIWANHLLRSSIQAMQRTAAALWEANTPAAVEDAIVPVREVFRLQGADALRDAEDRYLPKEHRAPVAVVLAAAQGTEMGELTKKLPKTMLPIGNQPLLGHIAATYRALGITRIYVVRGHGKEMVSLPSLDYVDNDRYADSGELYSLALALPQLDAQATLIVCYGDVLFKKHLLELLLDDQAPLAVAIDTNWQESVNRHRHADYVHCSQPYSRAAYGRVVTLGEIDTKMAPASIHGEWTGFIKVAPSALATVRTVVADLLADSIEAKVPDLLNELVRRGQSVHVQYIAGNWIDIDSVEDLINAGGF